MAVSEQETQARQAFGSVLARLREARGLSSQVELRDRIVALGVNVTPAYVGMWETGTRAPNAEHMRALEVVLDAPGLGLILGIDTGSMARLTAEVTELRRRVAAIEGATNGPGAGERGINSDPDLDDAGREYLLAAYRQETEAAAQNRSPTSPEPTSGRRRRARSQAR